MALSILGNSILPIPLNTPGPSPPLLLKLLRLSIVVTNCGINKITVAIKTRVIILLLCKMYLVL